MRPNSEVKNYVFELSAGAFRSESFSARCVPFESFDAVDGVHLSRPMVELVCAVIRSCFTGMV